MNKKLLPCLLLVIAISLGMSSSALAADSDKNTLVEDYPAIYEMLINEEAKKAESDRVDIQRAYIVEVDGVDKSYTVSFTSSDNIGITQCHEIINEGKCKAVSQEGLTHRVGTGDCPFGIA